MNYGFFGSRTFKSLPVIVYFLIVFGFIVFDPFGNGPSETLMMVVFAVALAANLIVIVVRRARHESVVHRITWFAKSTGWATDHLTDIVTLLPKRLLSITGLKVAMLIQRQIVAQKILDGHQAYLAFIEYYIPGPKNSKELKGIIVAQSKLSAPIPGYVRILPASNPWLRYLPDVDLESHQFNQDVYLTAEPKKLATSVFSPDVMAWYLDQPIRPYIHIENDRVCVLATDDVSYEGLESLTRQIVEVVKKVERSGALEKPPKIVLQD